MSLEPPPQVVEPSVLPAPVEPRQPLGWVLLGLFFALTISLSLASSTKAKPEGKKKTAELSPYEIVLRNETNLRSLSDLQRSMNMGERADETKKQAEDSLREPISEIAETSTQKVELARWYAAMRTEKGDPVPAANLAPLKKSPEASDGVLADIYEHDKLSQAEADKLVARLPKDGFLFKLAKVHALEKAGDTKIRGETFPWQTAALFFFAATGALVIFLGGGIVWALYLRAYGRRTLRPLGFALRLRNDTDADRAALRAAEILIAFMVIQIVVGSFFAPRIATLVGGAAILVCLPLLALTPVWKKRLSLRDVGLHFDDFGKNVLWGIGAFMAQLPVTLLLAAVGSALFSFLPEPTHPATQELLSAKNLTEALPIMLFGSITAPIWEEFVFRGLLFPGLTRLTRNLVSAAILNGFLFAMIHPQGPSLWLSLAWIGTVGCVLNYQRRSLIPSIVMHMLHNLAVFVFTFVLLGLR